MVRTARMKLQQPWQSVRPGKTLIGLKPSSTEEILVRGSVEVAWKTYQECVLWLLTT